MTEVFQGIITQIPEAVINLIYTAIVALVTYLISKFKNPKASRNLEIAYDNIYYPLYKTLRDNKQNSISKEKIIEFRDFFRDIIETNDKYVDQTTINVFNQLNDAISSNNEYKIREIYEGRLWDNINNNNNKLRHILGYLQPNIFQLYKYSSPKARFVLSFILLIIVGFICIQIAFMMRNVEIVFNFLMYILMTVITLLLINMIWFIITQGYSLIKSKINARNQSKDINL